MLNQHSLYQELWNVIECADRLYEHLQSISASDLVDSEFHRDITGYLASLYGMRGQVVKRLKAIEEHDEVSRLQRKLAEAQARIRELEQRSGGDGG